MGQDLEHYVTSWIYFHVGVYNRQFIKHQEEKKTTKEQWVQKCQHR